MTVLLLHFVMSHHIDLHDSPTCVKLQKTAVSDHVDFGQAFGDRETAEAAQQQWAVTAGTAGLWN